MNDRLIFFCTTFLAAAQVSGASKAPVSEKRAYTQAEMSFFRAADSNNVEKVKECIAAGMDVNNKGIHDTTALHFAVGKAGSSVHSEENVTATVTALLKAGANANAINTDSATPLYILTTLYSEAPYRLTTIKALLDGKADPNLALTWKDKAKGVSITTTPLIDLARRKTPYVNVNQAIQLLIEAKANPTIEGTTSALLENPTQLTVVKENALQKAIYHPDALKILLTSPYVTKRHAQEAAAYAAKKNRIYKYDPLLAPDIKQSIELLENFEPVKSKEETPESKEN